MNEQLLLELQRWQHQHDRLVAAGQWNPSCSAHAGQFYLIIWGGGTRSVLVLSLCASDGIGFRQSSVTTSSNALLV